MESLKLLVKSHADNTYLVRGTSSSGTIEPTQWDIPLVPNEYGMANAERVVRKYVHDNLQVDHYKIELLDNHAKSIKVNINQGLTSDRITQLEDSDPDDLFEYIRFVDAHDFTKCLKKYIYVEPSTEVVRPYLVEYIKILINEAKQLSEDELVNGEGIYLATDICGALIHQDAEGIKNNGWFKSEPILARLLDASNVLDADTNNLDMWQTLFETANEL